MHSFQLSLFYDLQTFIQTSSFYRKYVALFKALDLASLPDVNHGAGRNGYSRHAILRALLVKHLEGIKSIPQLIRFAVPSKRPKPSPKNIPRAVRLITPPSKPGPVTAAPNISTSPMTPEAVCPEIQNVSAKR